MNEQAKENLQKDMYFRIVSEEQNGTFQYIPRAQTKNIIHSLVMEIEKPGSLYNRFKDNYKVQFFNYDEKEMKMTMIKEFKFTELNNYGKPKAN